MRSRNRYPSQKCTSSLFRFRFVTYHLLRSQSLSAFNFDMYLGKSMRTNLRSTLHLQIRIDTRNFAFQNLKLEYFLMHHAIIYKFCSTQDKFLCCFIQSKSLLLNKRNFREFCQALMFITIISSILLIFILNSSIEVCFFTQP